jgi:hypothetical protein
LLVFRTSKFIIIIIIIVIIITVVSKIVPEYHEAQNTEKYNNYGYISYGEVTERNRMSGGDDGSQGFPLYLTSVDHVKALVAGECYHTYHVVPATNIRVNRRATQLKLIQGITLEREE